MMSPQQSEVTTHVERAIPGTESWKNLHADHLARYLRATDYVRGRHVLDAGTGPGYGAAILKEAGALSVQAVDIDAPTIEGASRAYPVEGLSFLVDDCETLSRVRGPIEVICSFENLEHLQHPERFLEAAARLLPADGLLLCSTPDREATGCGWVEGKPGNPYHVNEFYYVELYNIIEKYFSNIRFYSQVITHSSLMKKKSAEALVRQLSYLWSDPWLRLGRAAGRMMGRKREWPDVSSLAAYSPADYPVVPRHLANLFGEPWCHFMICLSPRQ
jgi:SAM-dependent methyltransferase